MSHPNRLHWLAVVRIRRGKSTVTREARRFGVSKSAVSQWLRRKRYQRNRFQL